MNKENEKKEQIALAVGFVLILIVIIITLFRSNMFSSNKSSSQTQSDLEADQSNTLPYKTIAAKDLQKKIMLGNKDGKITLLDIRPFESYIQQHILDSINISLDEFPVGSKIDAHSKVVVIGASTDDKDIENAVDRLKDEKIEDVVALAGGMDAWKQLAGVTVTYGDPKSFVDQSKVSYLDPSSLNDALTQKAPVFIVDVRSGDEYAKGHIAGAKNIPFDEIEKRRGEITEKKVVVVGANELQEFQASVQIYDMLLVSPYVMRTAMPGWQDKGFALVK